MSDASRASIEREIESKRRKLEELKRLRAQRVQQQQASGELQQAAVAQVNAPAQSAEDILSSVSSLIAAPPAATSPANAAAAPAASHATTPAPAPAAAPRPRVQLSASPTMRTDLPASDSKIVYEQSTQTELKRKQQEFEVNKAVAESAPASTASVWDSIEADERDEIIQERDELRTREVALLSRIRELTQATEARAAKDEAAQEQALHAELPPGEAEKLMASEEFTSFLDRSSKIVERLLGYESARGSGGGVGAMASALAGGFDYMADYATADDSADRDKSNARGATHRLTPSVIFSHETTGGASFARTTQRPITAIDWSPKYPELLLAAYAPQGRAEEGGNADGLSMDPDGSVLVWNLHMSKRPEYTFSCQSGVHTAKFHPAHPKLIVGGCENGQLVIWDLRVGGSKQTPVNRSSLSHGHTHPVFALDIQPMASGVYQLVSASSDGQVCVWTENNLHRPLHDVQLVHLRPALNGADAASSVSGVSDVPRAKEDITTTCFDLPTRDSTNSLLLGSDEGRIYKARLHDGSAGSVDQGGAHERIYEMIQAHEAPMSSLQFHPTFKSAANAAGHQQPNDLFLTSSYDWTVKLWSNRLSKPLFVFESARDYVHAAAWCPTSPYVFASGDGTGRLDVWSLGGEGAAGDDVDVPAVSVQVGGSGAGAGAGASGGVDGSAAGAASASAGGAASGSASGTSADAGGDGSAASTLQSLRPNHAISTLKWNHTGDLIACGLSSGALHLYEVSADLHTPSREGTERFYAKVAQRIAEPR